jgi:hypothetical protein
MRLGQNIMSISGTVPGKDTRGLHFGHLMSIFSEIRAGEEGRRHMARIRFSQGKLQYSL